MDVKPALSSLLLAAGLLLVFLGMSSALGYNLVGMVVTFVTIAALVYAGGVWFGTAGPGVAVAGEAAIVVFDRALQVAAGPGTGGSVLAAFPAAVRPEVELHCRAALRGEHSHFSCIQNGRRVTFDAAPVQAVTGVVLFGALITGRGAEEAAVQATPLTTVA